MVNDFGFYVAKTFIFHGFGAHGSQCVCNALLPIIQNIAPSFRLAKVPNYSQSLELSETTKICCKDLWLWGEPVFSTYSHPPKLREILLMVQKSG